MRTKDTKTASNKLIPKTAPFYSITGAGRYAEMTEANIRRAIKAGELQEHRTVDGLSPLIAVKELDRWLKKRSE